jgi:glycosyltransferase involved in cell wall biosynthesis
MNGLGCRVGPPRISVVTACLNAEKTIERTLKSIEVQGYDNLQLIVVDGLSRDRTIEIVRQYGHLVSHFISEKDRGVAHAINKGFRLATGDILCYLNADDCFAPGALHRVAEQFSAQPEMDVIAGGCQRVYADGTTVRTQVPERFERLMALRNDIEQPSTFWRASIHRKSGELDESYALAFDWEWWNRLRSAGARFKAIEDVLSIYYFTDDNLTSRAGMRVVNEMYRVTKTYGPYGGHLAHVYRMLFRFFDMKGYYDQPFAQLGLVEKYFFGGTLSVLYTIFGRETINAYNWNWASKQIRGITWYK